MSWFSSFRLGYFEVYVVFVCSYGREYRGILVMCGKCFCLVFLGVFYRKNLREWFIENVCKKEMYRFSSYLGGFVLVGILNRERIGVVALGSFLVGRL